MSGWKQVHTMKYIPQYRDGWKGVWDAFKSAITGKPRFTIIQPMTFSVWVKSEDEVKIDLYGLQLKVHHE